MKLSENTMKYSKKIFNNTYFLYFMLVLAIMNVVLYLNTNNNEALFMFISVGIILKQFTENNSIVLLSCIILTNTYLMLNDTIVDGFRSRYNKNKEVVEGFKKNNLKKNGLKNKGLKSGMSDLSKLDDDDDDIGSSFIDKNYINNITTYNQMTEAYNNLVKSIREKTKNIKAMSKKIKLK
jgi:hypothetical protein